jgi:hypothetical protein
MAKVGSVDANGVLWKATQPGKLTEGYNGCANLYESLANSVKMNLTRKTAGARCARAQRGTLRAVPVRARRLTLPRFF